MAVEFRWAEGRCDRLPALAADLVDRKVDVIAATGGIVSAITKSGGNEFSGSVRDTLDNPKWTELSVAGQTPPVDHTNNTYEETLGGRIMRAETAAIAIAALLQHRFGDLG